MIIDDTEELQIVLGSTPTTELDFFASYGEDSGSDITTKNNDGTTSGTTDVVVVPTPANGSNNIVRTLQVFNPTGNSAINVTIKLDDGTNERIIVNRDLSSGDTLEFSEDGWTLSFGGSANADRVDVQDDGSLISSDASVLNFKDGFFDVTNPSGDEADVSLTDASISNAKLGNSSVTVAGNSVNLGGSTTVDHADLSNIPSNDHIDHSTVNISSGEGLTGGGDITADRTIAMAIQNMTSLTASPDDADQIAIYDSSAGTHKEIDITELEGAIDLADLATQDHSDLTGISSNQHHVRPVAGDGIADNSDTFDVRLDIDDSGTNITTAYGIDFGTNLNVTDDTDNTVTVDVPEGMLDLEDDGASILTDATILNFAGSEFDVTNPTGTTGKVVLTTGGVANSKLTNSSVTVAGNSVSLGGSTAIATPDLSDTNFGTRAAGQLLIWDNTNNEWVDATLTAGNAVAITNADGSVTIAVDSNSIGSDELVNDSVTVAGNTVALGSSTTVSADDLSDIASSTESAGQLLIWNGTSTQYENAGLTGGNAIDVTNADASVTLAVSTDSIQTDELDLTISPSWTGDHDFSGGGLTFPTSTTPSPTTEGKAIWDSDDDELKVGTGGSTITVGSGSGGLNWQVISTDTTALAGQGFLIDASSNNVTLTLPSSPSAGDQVGAVDYTNNSTTNTITIARNGNNIEGSASDLTLDVDGAGFTLVYSDTNRGWEIVTEVGAENPVDIEDNGSTVVEDADAINFKDNLSVTDDGDGSVTVDSSASGSTSESQMMARRY